MITALPRIAIAVADFDAAASTFRDILGMPVSDFSDRTVPDLGAHVGMCIPTGGSNIELMGPATAGEPLSEALSKCLDRRGEGFYALMLEAPDPNAEADELADRGIEVLPLMPGAGGRDLHPRSTHGVLIRVYPNNSVPDQGPQISAPPAFSGIMRAIIATDDATKAADTYGRGLGLSVDEPVSDTARGVLSVRCNAPKGGSIELVSVTDASRPFAKQIATHLGDKGEGLYGIVLHSDDPSAAAKLLEDRGLTVHHGESIEADVFGARVLLEPR